MIKKEVKQRLRRKAQVATEYLVIVAFIVVILVPVTIIYIKYTGSTQDVVGGAKTSYIAKEISKAANEVYSYGIDSQKKISVSFPENVQSVSFLGNELVFTIIDSKGGVSDIVEVADVNFKSTTLPVTSGQKEIIVKAVNDNGKVAVLVLVACSGTGSQQSTDGNMCMAICNDPNPPCTLLCSNSAWRCSSTT